MRRLKLMLLGAVVLPPLVSFGSFEVLGGKIYGGARAYFESAYCSSTGRFSYTEPIAEQYYDLTYATEEFGRIRFDCWSACILNNQTDDVHRRWFYCWEPTLMYSYELEIDKEHQVSLDQSGGILWDWLNGYYTGQKVPYCWYAYQSLHNPYLIPYWNALGGFQYCDRWVRIRFGLQHDWKPVDTVTVSPFVDVTWGNPKRFKANFGQELDDHFLGGAVMFGNIGVIARWYFAENWYLWGRFKEYVVIHEEARRAVRHSKKETDVLDYPIFGLGIGVRF